MIILLPGDSEIFYYFLVSPGDIEIFYYFLVKLDFHILK